MLCLLLSLSLVRPEPEKGIRSTLQESSDAGKQAVPAAVFAQQSAIMQWEEKVVLLQRDFHQELMELQAWSPGMALREAQTPLWILRGHEMVHSVLCVSCSEKSLQQEVNAISLFCL